MKKYELTNGELISPRKLLKSVCSGKLSLEVIKNPDQLFYDNLFKKTELLHIIPKEYIQEWMVNRVVETEEINTLYYYSNNQILRSTLALQAIPSKFLTAEMLLKIADMKKIGSLTIPQFQGIPHEEIMTFADKCPNMFYMLPIEEFNEEEQLGFIRRGYKIIDKANLMKLYENPRIEYVGQNPSAVRWLSDEHFLSEQKMKPYIASMASHLNELTKDKNNFEKSEKRIEEFNDALNFINQRRSEALIAKRAEETSDKNEEIYDYRPKQNWGEEKQK